MNERTFPSEKIPLEFRQTQGWVNYITRPRKDNPEKTDKLPVNPRDLTFAKSNDPSTWTTFDEALKRYQDNESIEGIGFVFSSKDPYYGLDLDSCLINGNIAKWAQEILLDFPNAYCERSHSRTGLHLIGRGKKLLAHCKKGDIELYDNLRFFTVTGDIYKDQNSLGDCQDALDRFMKSTWPKKIEPQRELPNTPLTGDWEDRLEKALQSKNGADIKRLYDGDFSSYPSQSEADLAFCAGLAFWFQGDPGAMDQVFRASGLFRKKWDEKHGATSYGQMTISKAIAGCKEFYREPSANLRNNISPERVPAGEPVKRGNKITLLNLDDLTSSFTQGVEWLWRRHIPKGMPVIINGREGEGKTTICIQTANEILLTHPEGIVLWIASEGFVQDTFSKMDALGSDRRRLRLVRHANETFQFNFDLQSDRRLLDEAMTGQNVLAVFIDSIRGITPFDDNDSKVKNVMLGLNSIVCDKHGASLIYIDHHKKGLAASMLDRSVGTTAKTAAVRRVFSVIPASTYIRKIVLAKSNILGEPPPELLAALSRDKMVIYEASYTGDTTIIGQAEQWLIGMFAKKGTYKTTELYDMGKEYGFSSDALKKAKLHLNINSWNEGVGKPWFWTCETFL